MPFSSFHSFNIDLGNERSLRVFVGPQPAAFSNQVTEEAPVDAFVSTADLAAGFGLKSSSIRGELSKNKLGTLVSVPRLKSWMIDQKIIPSNSGKVNFATKDIWLRLVKRHFSDETYRATIIAVERAILEAETTTNSNDNNETNHNNDNNNHDDNNSESLSCRGSDGGCRDEGDGGDGGVGVGVSVSPTQLVVSEEEDVQKPEEEKGYQFHHVSEDRDKEDGDYGDNDDGDNGGDEDWEEDALFERKNEMKRGRGGIDSDVGSNDSPANCDSSLRDFDSRYDGDSNSHSSDGSSSCSSDSHSSDGHVTQLPVGRGDCEWALTVPMIPDQFSVNDYTKAHSLKEYDISRSLKKELKKLNSWWTTERNNERKNKAVASTTAGKREERALCFLGFVDRYRCLPPNHKLTLYLFLNHRLMEGYLEYLKQVRKSSPGTLSETLTAAISVCRWLYRKSGGGGGGGGEPLIIRRYKDWRNLYQAKAAKIRKMDDVDELKEQNKWLSWDQFLALVKKMRLEWDRSQKLVNIESAVKLHDLLLLGIYSCVPSRGSEIRLLQHLSIEEITRRKGSLTTKRFVDKEKINLITQTLNVDEGGSISSVNVWKIFVADFKNYRSVGVDVTELSSFQWWTDLFELYMASYRSLLVDTKNKHNYVFLTKTGKPFSASYYSDYIASLLHKHTGVRAATNLLRSSFVTSFYGSEASKDFALRDSVASVMRHSTREAQKTYDRRTATQRKRAGLQLIADMHTISPPKKRPQSDEFGDDEETPPLPPPPSQQHQIVVEYSHVPYCVIQEEASRYLLAKMQRSSRSNAPRYFVAPNVIYEWQEKEKCNSLPGEWEENEYVLV